MDQTSFLRLDRLYSGAAECGSVVFFIAVFCVSAFCQGDIFEPENGTETAPFWK
jgi:hypothetical protein